MTVEEKRTEIELAQLHDGNPYNDKIKEIWAHFYTIKMETRFIL
jgi:hypothetical protein